MSEFNTKSQLDISNERVNLLFAFIFVQKFLQHSRLYRWDSNVRIYSNSMQFYGVLGHLVGPPNQYT